VIAGSFESNYGGGGLLRSDQAKGFERLRCCDAAWGGIDNCDLRVVAEVFRKPGLPSRSSPDPILNVFYEVGLCHAIGKPVILLIEGDQVRLISGAFDTQVFSPGFCQDSRASRSPHQTLSGIKIARWEQTKFLGWDERGHH
jgi:hypothetical protein